MNAEITELIFILDRSGSMNGLESDTIGGFNGMISKQKTEGEKINITTVLFDEEIEIVHDRISVSMIEPLTDKEYYVHGCTALLDAVGMSIKKIENVQNNLPDSQKAGKIIFVITTDGLENSSVEYCYSDIKEMINTKRECGWEFIFLGANINVVKEAEKLGISRKRAVTYENDCKGVAINYDTIGKIALKVAKNRTCSVKLEDDWADEIIAYCESKKGDE